jgi:isoleucyl-tRNA synthetase
MNNPENQNNTKSNRAMEEEKILDFWQEKNIFEKSLEKESPLGEYTFYEGPPTANGKPGIHHLEARSFKDAIPRYKTMRGYHVRRKGGWDTHGLPVELQVEKELGLKSKKEVEQYGVAEFNKKCKESVGQYLDIWTKFTDRIGYWVDQKNPYFTYHNSYIESVWNVVGNVHEKNLLYKDYKVVPWCPRCGTALSSHELAQGYVDVKDLSVYAKFKVIGQENTYILAWTTTPWTLPGNVALAVGNDIEYQKYKIENGDFAGQTFIYAKEKHSDISPVIMPKVDSDTVNTGNISYIKGSDLVGLEYEPLYPYLKDALAKDDAYTESRDKAFKVYPADFVTTTDGTGVVHTAVMYGQDDFELGTKIGLPKFHTVDVTGNFIGGTDFLEGRFVKDEAVAIDIIKDLAHRGLLFKKEKYEHSYPHCWRCKTPLIYYARDSWYIRMSQLREQLVDENQYINWEPAYIRDGRFGEWLKDVKDWAISRERYWGTPLPIWEKENGERVVIDSIDTLKKYTKKSGNTYFAVRHGQGEHNLQDIASSHADDPIHLTELGKTQAKKAGEDLKEKKITAIYASPFIRTRETIALIAQELNFPIEKVIFDKRLGDIDAGVYEGKPFSFINYFKNLKKFDEKIEGGESPQDVKNRMGQFLYEVDKNHTNENVLIVTHGIFFEVAPSIVNELDGPKSLEELNHLVARINPGDTSSYTFSPLPHNENYELDLHKPYIDEIELVDEAGNTMTRVKEVMDVWFDSGCMPFAQDHYPFSTDHVNYPADFICEAIDQTRGWFYTLHAVGILTGKGKAYKNVICLGHILDEQGKKMSKSLGNIVDPWEMMEKYGVDPLRFWMYTVNQPGEPKNFDEKTVLEISRKVFTLLDNVVTFYELYRDTSLETNKVPDSSNVLDAWILAQLSELTKLMTENMDAYKLLEPGRALRDFIDDLSTWYLRRSRDRLKEGDKDAKKTLYYVLKTVSKLLAPFAPFMGESLYQKLRTESDSESVHLETWPEASLQDTQEAIKRMATTKMLVSLGLQARQKAGIAVRQPLASVTLKASALDKDYIEIMKDELNVKDVSFDEAQGDEVVLDTTMTRELKAEGNMREFIRAVQDMRKKKGLQPSDVIDLVAEEVEKSTLLEGLNAQDNVATLTLYKEDVGEKLLYEFKEYIVRTIGGKVIDLEFGSGNANGKIMEGIKFVVKL